MRSAFPLLLCHLRVLLRFLEHNLWIFSTVDWISAVGDGLTVNSSHIHCPVVEKLKYCPRIAKPFIK